MITEPSVSSSGLHKPTEDGAAGTAAQAPLERGAKTVSLVSGAAGVAGASLVALAPLGLRARWASNALRAAG